MDLARGYRLIRETTASGSSVSDLVVRPGFTSAGRRSCELRARLRRRSHPRPATILGLASLADASTRSGLADRRLCSQEPSRGHCPRVAGRGHERQGRDPWDVGSAYNVARRARCRGLDCCVLASGMSTLPFEKAAVLVASYVDRIEVAELPGGAPTSLRLPSRLSASSPCAATGCCRPASRPDDSSKMKSRLRRLLPELYLRHAQRSWLRCSSRTSPAEAQIALALARAMAGPCTSCSC